MRFYPCVDTSLIFETVLLSLKLSFLRVTKQALLMFELLHELQRMSLESLLAGHAAKMISFAFECDLEFGCLIVQNNTAHWILRHYSCLNLMEE